MSDIILVAKALAVLVAVIVVALGLIVLASQVRLWWMRRRAGQ